MKKSTPKNSPPKEITTCIQSIPFLVDQLSVIPPTSYIITSKDYKSSIDKVILDSGVIDHFFTNYKYISNYKKFYHKFQTDSGKILPAHR